MAPAKFCCMYYAVVRALLGIRGQHSRVLLLRWLLQNSVVCSMLLCVLCLVLSFWWKSTAITVWTMTQRKKCKIPCHTCTIFTLIFSSPARPNLPIRRGPIRWGTDFISIHSACSWLGDYEWSRNCAYSSISTQGHIHPQTIQDHTDTNNSGLWWLQKACC